MSLCFRTYPMIIASISSACKANTRSAQQDSLPCKADRSFHQFIYSHGCREADCRNAMITNTIKVCRVNVYITKETDMSKCRRAPLRGYRAFVRFSPG